MTTLPNAPSDGYERPNCRHRCGRGAVWGTPCSEGPNPDGTCSQSHQPCVPRSTLRARRGWLTVWASLVTALLLAAGFHFGAKDVKRPISADPGPLSSSHAAFTAGIAVLVRDSSLRARLSAGATDWARRFDWDTCARSTLRILDSEFGARPTFEFEPVGLPAPATLEAS